MASKEENSFQFNQDEPRLKACFNIVENIGAENPAPIGLTKIHGQVSDKADTAAVILAGGQGTRFTSKNSIPKQLINLAGKPVLTWSMDSFDAVPDIGVIIVVCPEDHFQDYIETVIDPFAFQTPVLMAPAGDTRQESSFNGMDLVPDKFKYVVIHDGARPLVPPSVIKHLISVLKGFPDIDGAVTAHPAIDTLKVVEGDEIVGTPDRSCIWNVQTPQAFLTKTYKDAHLAAFSDGFVGSDDASLIERIGGHVKVVKGQRNNIKLTVPEDYFMLDSMIKALELTHGSEYDFED